MILGEKGFRIKKSGILGITFKNSEDMVISILKSGTMIVQSPPQVKNNPRDNVLETYKSILIDGLGLPHAILPVV